MFDFQKPHSRDFTETISILAQLSFFVVADITDPRSVPQELMKIVPASPSVVVQPILKGTTKEDGMFADIAGYPWVLPVYRYKSVQKALAELGDQIIRPAEAKAKQILEELQKGAASGSAGGD
jgi:hypothetical protein